MLTSNFARITSSTPALRLSGAGWLNSKFDPTLDIASTELMYEFCRAKILSRIPPFSKSALLFIEQYLSFIKNQIETHQSDLPTDGIIQYQDWIFSAWLPLPNAQILLPSDLQSENKKEAKFFEIDVLFWTGAELIGVQLGQGKSMIKSEREKLDLAKSSIPNLNLIQLGQEHLSKDTTDFPTEKFDESFVKFWQDLSLPQGPSLSDETFDVFSN